jgi:hypothetical protein
MPKMMTMNLWTSPHVNQKMLYDNNVKLMNIREGGMRAQGRGGAGRGGAGRGVRTPEMTMKN